jgi:hypothetical protein
VDVVPVTSNSDWVNTHVVDTSTTPGGGCSTHVPVILGVAVDSTDIAAACGVGLTGVRQPAHTAIAAMIENRRRRGGGIAMLTSNGVNDPGDRMWRSFWVAR